jgi:hypothetical protein
MVFVTFVSGHIKETEAMLSRCWGLAIVGVVAFALAPAWGQTTAYNKDAVKALAKQIDDHLAKVWKKAKVTPAAKAEDHIFFRRLNLDLNGCIPDLIAIDDFLSNDDRDKRWIWVDQMLESKEHARHMANVWRNTIIGNQTNPQFQFQMGQFENWLRSRIDKNIPLDQTVMQLLTAQQGGPNQPGIGRMDPNGAESPQLFFQVNENKAENLAGATSRLFLGVKIECAQCHKHPFAKWTQDQFWEFAAFYSSPQFQPKGKGPAVPQPGFQPGREILVPGTDRIVKAKYLNGKEPNWEGTNNARKTLAEWVTAKDNPYFARAMADHLWSYLMGVSLLEPILEPSDDNLMTHPELLDALAKALIDNNFDAKFLIRAIVHSDAYQRSSGGVKLADKEDYQLFIRMPMRSLSPEQIYDSVVAATTSPHSDLRKQLMQMPNPQQFFNPGQNQAPRAQFLTKFQNQDRRHEPQTSILQALFMMNGKMLADRTKLSENEDLRTLAGQKTTHDQRLKSLYMMVLSRPPREAEYQRLVPYLERGGTTGSLGDAVTDIYWALLNSSEFLLNH